VDPNNHDRLYPVGTVGELALEGPVLAREYLKNPEKTASAFITNPKWARGKAHGKSNRRIYLTGDLARLTVDGSLEYVGRKDNQVKLHGQRMELGEIEYRLHEHPHVRHVVIVLPKTGRLQKRLVAILSLNSLSTETSLISSAGCSLVAEHLMEQQGMDELMEVQGNLASQLPPYMVPQTWAVIDSLPMLVSGKIDRKKITSWVEAVDDTTYNRVMRGYDKLKRSKAAVSRTSVSRKKDDTLSVLQEILAHVLNTPADKIDVGMPFTSIGEYQAVLLSSCVCH
jgi:acyl-coenzyme A synthetase/AMP-(fatty) acid ligase